MITLYTEVHCLLVYSTIIYFGLFHIVAQKKWRFIMKYFKHILCNIGTSSNISSLKLQIQIIRKFDKLDFHESRNKKTIFF